MNKRADICLLLEGTYPYVTGGVSSWVHELISNLHEFSFALVVILPDRKTSMEVKYPLPANVCEIRPLFLHELELPHQHATRLPERAWEDLDAYHNCPFNAQKTNKFESVFQTFFNPESRGIAPSEIMDRKEAWHMLSELYENNCPEASFIDYFWTFRFMHHPIFKILSAELPDAGVYHTVSTGFAGLLAVAAKLRFERPVVLTEHGIYTRERRIEISRADWIYEKDADQIKVRRSQSRFKELWNNMFGSLSRLCYHYSDAIITLFKGNQTYQLQDGANPEKMGIIPNGIEVGIFSALAQERKSTPDELVLGFMGRVVSIKDVKTFIRACKGVVESGVKVKAYIMGPTDEEETYYEECVKLTELLGLKSIVEFTGKVEVTDYYPRIDILVLTSISEAQPLVILEANCMGIPVVATDVGACKEMLYGRTPEDQALGKSGLITGLTNSDEVAKAILKIWCSPQLREQMAEAGKQRVMRYYNRTDLDHRYRKLYTALMQKRMAWQA